MANFMAVHTLPITKEQAIEMSKQTEGKMPAGMVWKQTYCDFNSHKFFCDWEAPNREALEAYFKATNMPFEAIFPVELFEVASRSFKG